MPESQKPSALPVLVLYDGHPLSLFGREVIKIIRARPGPLILLDTEALRRQQLRWIKEGVRLCQGRGLFARTDPGQDE